MIYNEEAYYTGYYRNVRVLGAITALVFDTICGLLRNNESGEIANKTLREFLGCTKPTLNNAVKALEVNGYILCKTGVGRGNSSIYALTEKGKENCPFMDEKRETMFQKKGNKVSIKGKQCFPINKELNKELNNQSRAHATLMDGEEKDFNKDNYMEHFADFWNLFEPDGEYQNRRMACADLWANMTDNYRAACIAKLQENGKPAEPNPYFYLQKFAPELLNGNKKLDKLIAAGTHIVQVKVDGKYNLCTYDEATLFGLDITQEHFLN